MTLVEILENHAKIIPGKTAIVHGRDQLSFVEMNEIVNRLAHSLLDMGLKKGDRVGLMLPRIPELVIGFLGTAKARGIVVPVNADVTHESLRGFLKIACPHILIVHHTFWDRVKTSILDDAELKVIVVGGESGKAFLTWNEVTEKRATTNPGLEIQVKDTVYLNYTSGSTGMPKGAVTSHENIYWNTAAVIEFLELTPNDVHLCMFAPFAHPHEIFSRALYLGGTVVLVDKIYPKSIAQALADHRVTCMMGLAPMYENLLEMLKHKTYDLSSLRIAESGGMYTRPELIERFKQKVGISILPVWGSTETTGVALANEPGHIMPDGSVGKPCTSYKVKIVDEEGVELPPGEVGELIFKGPAVVQRYYKNSVNGLTPFLNGWYYSGDLGRKDDKGNFYFVDRKSGMMKVAGLKVYPLEIELVLLEHPNIKEVAVISTKDRLRGEVPKAILVKTTQNGLTEKEVVRFCKERLPTYKIPKIVEFRDSLPKIGSGKINKKIL